MSGAPVFLNFAQWRRDETRLGAGQPSEPHPLETMVDFKMRKTHLYALALIPRLEERAMCESW
jgi:hypothetical protein